jgi:hypothetical protein
VLNRYLVYMRNAAQRWFNFHNVGPSPHKRAYHAMASDGSRVFVLGGNSKGARADEISLIHVFDTSMYFLLVHLSGRLFKLRTQRTSNTQIPSVVMMSIPMRRPRNLRGSHPQVPRPRCNHSTLHPLHRRPPLLLFNSCFKTLTLLQPATLPPRRPFTEIPV